MRIDLPSQIDRKEWLQRMGVPENSSGQLQQQMDEAEEKLFRAAMPKGTYRFLAIHEVELPGNSINRHLQGCDEVIVMGVSLGAGVDQLIRTSQIRDMAEAVILDSGASILIEQIADKLEEQMETTKYRTPRFSPGYGDYPIEAQSQVVQLLDAQRKIGLTINRNHILIPRKSITAIIGLADHPVKGYLATCEECVLKETCALRKKGKNCAGL